MQKLSTIFKLKSSSSFKASNKRKWFISSFSFRLMDMVAFKASLKNRWPLHWFKMPTMTKRDNVYYNMWYVPFEWRGNTTNDPKTNMFNVIKGNGFLKLKFFFLHDHFVCKLANLFAAFWKTKIQNNWKGKKILKQVTCIFTLFWLTCSIFWV